MSKQIRLDYSEIQKAIERAKAERAKTLRRYGVALATMGSKWRTPAIAVAVVLLILFGAKVLLFSAAPAEANTVPVLSSSWPLP